MQNDINEEIVIDFNKMYRILQYRKLLIRNIFITVIGFVILLTFICPKKYKVEADLYVNKGNATNLVDLNPYIVSSLSGTEGVSSFLSGANNELDDELEIMQSPLVMDNVIKENDLRYKWGRKRGELLTTKDFLKKNISIENKKGTSVVNIEYKSKNPIKSYNVVNSIIANYEKVNEEINTKKSLKDKELLEASYEKTNKSLNQKLSGMKNSSALPATAMTNLGILAALKGHDRAISGAVGSMQSQIVEGQKSQIGIDQEVEKLKLVKSKLEWTKLVEQMSKNTTNVTVLKYPELKRNFDYSEPKFLINIILGLIFAVFASIIAVLSAESIDKSLTYSELGEKIIYDVDKNIEDLKLILLTNSKENISIIIFDNFYAEFLKNLTECNNFKLVKAEITSKTMDEIAVSNKLIFAGKIGKTSKKIYQQFKNMCKETNKTICAELIQE